MYFVAKTEFLRCNSNIPMKCPLKFQWTDLTVSISSYGFQITRSFIYSYTLFQRICMP